MSTFITLHVEADDLPREIGSLRSWLREDARTRQLPSPVALTPDPRHMGGATDVLQILLEPSGVATALITALVTWQSTRNRRVRLTVKTPTRSVEIEAGSPRDVSRIVRETLDQLEMSAEPEDPHDR